MTADNDKAHGKECYNCGGMGHFTNLCKTHIGSAENTTTGKITEVPRRTLGNPEETLPV